MATDQDLIDTDDGYVSGSGSWHESTMDRIERSRRVAWYVAAAFGILALLLAIAVVLMLPLKSTEPYTLLVDRQTGNVEALTPLDEQVITPDSALTRSFLVQYVVARESFDADSVQNDYRKVSLWSDGQARQRYQSQMAASNPTSPLNYMPRNGTISVDIRSISSLSANSSMVRFTTTRTDPGAQPQGPDHWAAVISYKFSGAEMSEADRLINPLGFQVTRYRRDPETLPEMTEAVQPVVLLPRGQRRDEDSEAGPARP